MSMPTVPTATTTARSRAMAPARFTGSLLGVSAVISTESTPPPRDARDLRMHGKTSTGAGDAIARLDIGNAFANRKHCASAAVTRTLRLIQTAADRLHGGKNPVPLHFADHLAHEVRTRSRFLQQV